MNRTKSEEYPDNVCDVVYQPKQFSDIDKVKPDHSSPEWGKGKKIAFKSFLGLNIDPTLGAKFYYNPKKVPKKPKWAKNLSIRIGNHNFYS